MVIWLFRRTRLKLDIVVFWYLYVNFNFRASQGFCEGCSQSLDPKPQPQHLDATLRHSSRLQHWPSPGMIRGAKNEGFHDGGPDHAVDSIRRIRLEVH